MTEILTKILITRHEQGGGKYACIFSRGDDGMIIGSAVNGTAQFGEDSGSPEIVRYFVKQEQAVEFLKKQCYNYLGREDVDFLHEDGEPMVRNMAQQQSNRIV